MKNLKIIPFFLSIIFSGCSSEKNDHPSFSIATDEPYCHGSFRIEEGFTLQQQEDIVVSVARMNIFLGTEYFSLSSNGKCPIYLGEISEYPDAEAICACTYKYNSGIKVMLSRLELNMRTFGSRFQTVIMHEFGHSIGMQHIDNSTNIKNFAIMAPSGKTVSEDFTFRDHVECFRSGFCMGDYK